MTDISFVFCVSVFRLNYKRILGSMNNFSLTQEGRRSLEFSSFLQRMLTLFKILIRGEFGDGDGISMGMGTEEI